MSERKRQEQNYILATATTIAVFCMGQIPGSIDAAISKITEYFNLSSTSGLYVTTVACLVSVAFSILLGIVAGKKIGFRPLILFCATVELVSALVPFFTTNFEALIFLRGLFGVGFGGMQSLENTVATQLIPPKKRAAVLGLGTFFGFGMNCVLQLIGGVLADRGWNYVFLNHLLLLIPYAVVLVGCSRLSFEGQEESTASDTGTEKGKLISGPVLQIWGLMLVVGVLIAPLLVGCSFLSEPINPSASVAGVVAVCFSVGCMIGGLLYIRVFNKHQRLALPLFLLVMAAGILGCALARSIVLLCVLIFIAGAGFAATQATAMLTLGMVLPGRRIAFASALMMALFNLGMFLSSSYESLVGQITGDALYTPLYLGAAVLLVLAVVYGAVSPLRGDKGA